MEMAIRLSLKFGSWVTVITDSRIRLICDESAKLANAPAALR